MTHGLDRAAPVDTRRERFANVAREGEKIDGEEMDGANTLSTIELERLRAYRLARVRDRLAAADLAGIVLFDPINIRYATDVSNMQVWCLHNPARYAFVATAGPVVMFEFKGSDHIAHGPGTVDEVRPATSWFYFTCGPRVAEKAKLWAAEIAELVTRHGGGNARLAYDRLDPAGAAELTRLGLALEEGQGLMEEARAIKSAEEIAAMKASIAVCEQGMRRMQTALKAGITENALWSILHETNIALGGEWIETRLLSSGPRTNPWYQECGPRVIEAGDIVAFDTDLIGPYGYCADISRSWLCGDAEPSDAQRRLYALAHEEVMANIEALEPGLGFRDYSMARGRLPAPFDEQRYAFRAHGVGLTDEWPGIVYEEDYAAWGYDGVFKENMTVCVEAYIGAPGGDEGIKLEEQVLITKEGAQALSGYPYEESLL
jgi:Xaa-Pro aminopeptidase